MTFEYDIFPALIGIAHITQQTRKCKYYAGLWADTFAQDMLWYCPMSRKRPSPNTYRAPTWSWASIIGEVRYRKEHSFLIHVTVLSKSTVPVAESELGQLKSGRVTLRGPCTVSSIPKFSVIPSKRKNTWSHFYPDVRDVCNYHRALYMHVADEVKNDHAVFLLFGVFMSKSEFTNELACGEYKIWIDGDNPICRKWKSWLCKPKS